MYDIRKLSSGIASACAEPPLPVIEPPIEEFPPADEPLLSDAEPPQPLSAIATTTVNTSSVRNNLSSFAMAPLQTREENSRNEVLHMRNP